MTGQTLPAQTANEARSIAKDAYIYGFPLVDNYRVLHSYFVDRGGPQYKGPWNTVHNETRVYTPRDTAIQSPNSDTPYTFLGADLRTEPLVLSVPAIPDGRYFSLQFIDLYTFNFAYVGSRATGNGGGTYLLAGPNWTDEPPEGIDGVIRCETELVLVIYRTQLIDPTDIENVKAIQSGYRVQPLSTFLGEPAPPAAPPVDWLTPLTPEEERTSPRFFDELNFLLQFCPTVPSEVELMRRFARLGIGAGQTFDPAADIRQAVLDGMADAWAAFQNLQEQINDGDAGSGDVFGTREHLRNNYLYRMSGAVLGIYGNSQDEAIYPIYFIDAGHQPLDGSHRYRLRFAPGHLPPVRAFWSVTMYSLPDRLLVANPLDRYLINSPMLPGLVRDPDGGLTLYIQHDSPEAGKAANWLPAPGGPFFLVMRLYWPKPETLDGRWSPPPLQRADN